jgi:hypothetical protein
MLNSRQKRTIFELETGKRTKIGPCLKASSTKTRIETKKHNSQGVDSIKQNAKGDVTDKDGNICKFFEMKNKKCPVDKEQDTTK